MIESENIAIVVLAAGYGPMVYAIRVMWQAVSAANEREASALREGIEIDRNYTAQVDAMSEVIASIQRTQRVAANAAKAGFDRIEQVVTAGADRIISEIRGDAA